MALDVVMLLRLLTAAANRFAEIRFRFALVAMARWESWPLLGRAFDMFGLPGLRPGFDGMLSVSCGVV